MKKNTAVKVLFSFAMVGVIILTLLTGCNGVTPTINSPAASSPAISSPAAAASTAANAAVTLKVGSTKAYKTTNRFSDYWYGVLTNLTTHDSLIKLGSDMKPIPWLAIAWEASADATTFTFTIAPNAKWQDGQPLTAEDVKFSVEYYRDYDTSSAWMKDVIQSIDVNGNKVTLHLSRSYGNLLTEFMTYSVLPKHIWAKVADPLKYDGKDMVIGSGPFVFQSWDPASGKFIFAANPDYFQGKPAVDRLEIDVFSNMDALVMALSRGDIDTWWDYSGEFPYTYIPTLIKSGKVEFASASFLGVPAALGFNLGRSPMNNLDFRQAVALSINYSQIVEQVFSNYGTVPAYGFVPSTHPNFNSSLPRMEYKPDEAKKLLDSAGLKDTNGDGIREGSDGKAMTLILLVASGNANVSRTVEMVAGYLKTAGIATQTKMVDSSTWMAAKDKMDYDIVFFRATPWGTLMHAGHGSGYFDSRRTGSGVLHNFDNAEYLAACDARLATGDAQEQVKWDLKIQELQARYLPGIALAWTDSVYPYSKNWSNWKVDHIFGGVFNSFSIFSITPAK
jgi:peptide/nickel transport system substrate-binding protein